MQLSRKRLFAVFIFFLASLLCLFLRLAYVQIFSSERLSLRGQNQSRVIIEMKPSRGRIVDRNGRDLALDVRLDSLYAISRNVVNKPQVAGQLSGILGIERSEILSRLAREKLFVWIARKIPSAKAQAIQKLNVKELVFLKESQRVYPKGSTACHLVGFTDIDNNGLEGIELHYDGYLKGVPGWRLAGQDAKRRELASQELEMVSPVDGYNVHLTIDEVIQSIAEKALTDACKKFNAKGGSIVVMEPKTGDILAMAVYPLYDLNNAKHSTSEVRRNRAITDLFEPGSVFKTITLSGILEEKVFGLEEKFFCENGSWAVAGKVLHDHHGHGLMTFREIIEKSSNIGTVKGAMRLGAERLYKTMRAFGFGQKTGIALRGEVSGMVPPTRNWSRSSIINIPIGQGVAVTPIQLTAAMAALANNGTLMKPRIVTHIDDTQGKVAESFLPETARQAVSKETAIQVRTVLEGVVSRGTGKKAAVPGFRAAGKTGTAQKILPNGTYSHDQFIASFVGLVPYDEPRLVIGVSLDEPHPVYYGGDAAAPAFSQVASETMAYWEISRTQTPGEVSRSGLKKIVKEPVQNVSVSVAGR